jgi:hypothetical protein
MDIRILICPLVSSDLERSIRCVKSAFNQKNHYLIYGVHVVINSLDEEFVLNISNFCDKNGIKYSITESNGLPSKGKNSVFDIFNQSEYTHLSQLDGDDIYYPSFLRHVQRHLKKYPTTDALATLPSDSIFPNENEWKTRLNCGLYVGCWGSNYHDYRTKLEFNQDKIIDPNTAGGNHARLVLFSKRVSLNFRYDEEQRIGEDYKLHFDLLKSHQNDEICYWFTTASDIWVRDTTSFGIQKKISNTIVEGEYIVTKDDVSEQKLRDYVIANMDVNRSAPGEVPIDYPPIYLSWIEKIEFLNWILES